MNTPVKPLGGRITPDLLSTKLPLLDLKPVFQIQSANPFLLKTRVAQGFVQANAVARALPTAPDAGAGTARPSAVDWRNRFGANWITSIYDQDPCESCWSYATTALVECMVRIEHGYWCKLSEADLHDGRNAKCSDGGSVEASLDWAKDHGIADYGCYPDNKNDNLYTPSWDRSGRTVKIGARTNLGDINQQKDWLDKVGPLAAFLEVWSAFDRYEKNTRGACFNHKQPGDIDRGGHLILVVGYDDTKQAWLIKNSWGTGWGESGFGWIGYGEFDIDKFAKQGITDVSPSPVTRLGYHNGAMVESSNGAQHRNFELIVKFNTGVLQHYWREGGESSFAWHAGPTLLNNAKSQPTLIQTTYNRNMELLFVNTDSKLQHHFFDQGSNKWVAGPVVGGQFDGVPGFIQNMRMAPGNFEVVCRTTGGQLKHMWRENNTPWTWHDGATFGTNIAFSGASLVQMPAGNLDLVAVNSDGTMQLWWFGTGPAAGWTAAEKFGANIASAPVMVQGNFGMANEKAWGNYELCVATKTGKIQHWWRNNANPAHLTWSMSAEFGDNVNKVVAVVQGSFGGNLEVIALKNDGKLHAFFRDGNGWHDAVSIVQAAPPTLSPVFNRPVVLTQKIG